MTLDLIDMECGCDFVLPFITEVHFTECCFQRVIHEPDDLAKVKRERISNCDISGNQQFRAQSLESVSFGHSGCCSEFSQQNQARSSSHIWNEPRSYLVNCRFVDVGRSDDHLDEMADKTDLQFWNEFFARQVIATCTA
jgi:hypothetical protein